MSAGIDASTAASLGFPKLKYAWVERERRWLCRGLPVQRVKRSEAIVDLYVEGTRLRLRRATPLDGGPAMMRLGCKADIDAQTRLLTSIYLQQNEFDLLAGLPGRTLRKTRHHLGAVNGAELSVDTFEGPLAGLVLAEAEFEDAESLRAYPDPDFAVRDVTSDARYNGGALAARGIPKEGEALR
jgi:CYTH domain-containing protein